MRQWIGSTLIQIMARRLFSAKPLNQCWVIVDWTLRNKIQRNYNQHTKLFINQNAFEDIVSEMAVILSRRRWVNSVCCVLAKLKRNNLFPVRWGLNSSYHFGEYLLMTSWENLLSVWLSTIVVCWVNCQLNSVYPYGYEKIQLVIDPVGMT